MLFLFFLFLVMTSLIVQVLSTQSRDNSHTDTSNNDAPLTVSYGSGTRAGLFRTPISGGVQSATSAHGLPRPALAVRNLMEQVKKKKKKNPI